MASLWIVLLWHLHFEWVLIHVTWIKIPDGYMPPLTFFSDSHLIVFTVVLFSTPKPQVDIRCKLKSYTHQLGFFLWKLYYLNIFLLTWKLCYPWGDKGWAAPHCRWLFLHLTYILHLLTKHIDQHMFWQYLLKCRFE